jgi:uncharacterized protein (DUF1778 family)
MAKVHAGSITSTPVAGRVAPVVAHVATQLAQAEGLTLSQFVARAVTREAREARAQAA